MTMKRWMVTGSFALLAVAMTACGGTKDATGGSDGSKQPEGEQAKDVSQSQAELNFYSMSGETEESFNERFGNPIRSKFPNYKINYIRSQKGSTLPELIAAGTRIDIYFDSIGNFASGLLANGLEYDMTALAKQRGVDLNRYEPTLIDAMKQMSGGKLYGLPVINNNLTLFYNKGLFDKFGVSHPKDGMTWTEANALASKLDRNDGGKQYLGLAVSPSHMLRMNQLSLPYLDTSDKATIQSNAGWKTLYDATMLQSAKDAGYREQVAKLKRLPYREALLTDQYLGMFVFLSQLPFTVQNEIQQIDWDMVALPTFESHPGVGSQSYPSYFSVTSQSKWKEEAAEVINYLGSDAYQMEASRKGTMPVLANEEIKKAYAQDTVFKGKNFGAVFYNKFAPISPKSLYDGQVEKLYTQDIARIITGEVDINTAFRTIEEAANKAVADAKATGK